MGKDPNKVELCHFLKVNMSVTDITIQPLGHEHTYCLSSMLLFLSIINEQISIEYPHLLSTAGDTGEF